jgi:Undecaprenyl-phosphate glucose phosphotransferase
MERVQNFESQAPELKIRRQLHISYYSVGLIGVCTDFLFTVAASIFFEFAYRSIFNELADNVSTSLAVGCLTGGLLCLIGRVLNLYTLSCLMNPFKYISKILLAWVSSVLLVTAVFFLLRAGADYSRGSTVSFAIFSPIPLIFLRALFAQILRSFIEQGAIRGRRAVIVGEEAELDQLSASALLIDFGLSEIARISFREVSASGKLSVEELAKLDGALTIARQQNADELIMAFDWHRSDLMQSVEEKLRLSPLPVRLLPDRAVQAIVGRGSVRVNGSLPSVELQRAPLTRFERLMKRTCDLILATSSLCILAPLMLLTALVIKLDSAGPVIFRQRRSGFNGRVFFILKFRTMSVMEDGVVIAQTQRVDPRVTRVGRFLRSSSIDELPQLINVLFGEMSLVGPRPHAVAHDDKYGAVISSYAYRHHVKPGITGWAQVNGQRGETRQVSDMARRIELDLWYVNNWSLLLDFRVIWRTCFELVRNRAY